VTLLYCFWATPPSKRTENYDSPDVFDAIRACSNILAIMADRWPRADCLRDVFELLAREIPLTDRPNRPPKRLSEKSIVTIRQRLPQVRVLIVHRSILRMIEEMITDDFPRLASSESSTRSPALHGLLQPLQRSRNGAVLSSPNQSNTSIPPSMLTFELPFATESGITYHGAATESLDADELLSFPGMFEYETWQ
jgi:hypothetical protein